MPERNGNFLYFTNSYSPKCINASPGRLRKTDNPLGNHGYLTAIADAERAATVYIIMILRF
ncbi:MAG: hypothetical protein NTY96_08475 [Bacteroidetes bacterium]|nr:hypothetical protein [Bacteroidota bacterium]